MVQGNSSTRQARYQRIAAAEKSVPPEKGVISTDRVAKIALFGDRVAKLAQFMDRAAKLYSYRKESSFATRSTPAGVSLRKILMTSIR